MDPFVMDRENMELVGVTVDAITFWAQVVNQDQQIKNINNVLAERCPAAPVLHGTPNPKKIYGAVFSGDSCWYRCKVLQQNDDKFQVSFIDYGNTELVSRLALVELPEDLQSQCFTNNYKLWGFHVSTDEDATHFQQGKAYLQNLIYGKKVRIQKKSVCFNGTILVQAFLGNLDIGVEVLKMKFATLNLPGGNCESPMSVQALYGYGDMLAVPVSMPKLRPAFDDQRPLSLKKKSSGTAQCAANLGKTPHQELVEENQRLEVERDAQQWSSQHKEHMLRESVSELQTLLEQTVNDAKEGDRCKAEQKTLQCISEQLEKHLQDAKEDEPGELQQKQVDRFLGSLVAEQFSRLAEKVNSLRGLRERTLGNTESDSLMESISVVINNRISAPVTMGKMDSAWSDYKVAQDKVKACQTKEQLGELMGNRDKVRAVLAGMVEAFIQEAKCLPLRQRMDKLEEVSASLTEVFGPADLEEDAGEQAFEQFFQWRTLRSRRTKSVRDETDKALKALCTWSENVGKFFCLSAKTTVSVKDVVDGVNEWIKRAGIKVAEELDFSQSVGDQDGRQSKAVSNAFHTAMQHIHKELGLLSDIMEKCLHNTKFQGDMLHWQSASPTPDALFSVKKHIRSLRSQLKWRQVEEGSLEEAEDIDLTKILKKKEEIAETRNALFQEIGQERQEYMKLSALAEGGFPELPLLYPEADIQSYMRSGGLLMKSLDRDMFDAEPMRELSGRRPLVCTEFQGQRVILKGYTVTEETEARMLQRTAQFHRSRKESGSQTDCGILPLLALFFGKSDPLAYVMVPYFPNASLGAVQAANPLTTTETVNVMRGVAEGLKVLDATGITHASLNPNNVFLLHRRQGMVGDFDFTKSPVQRAVDSGMVAGSISLVAPELRQAPGTPPSPASDMYSYGCLLLWLHAPGFHGYLDSGELNLDTSGVKLPGSKPCFLSFWLMLAG
ncbi:serine/threonine-protein kinase 31 isoform X2 [Esox lucius]|uniref:serine/threonine-protein kinase 31 isoform X2 n=1 Tax=Esox lucius TaxID=8010 RepID=UPI001476945C|nr:serine/threonine-protein kinase 31 isoform X2 [Esox lucius]